MSKFVNEIIKDLKENPQTFKDYHGCGVEKNNVKVYDYGNTIVLSVISVSVNGKDIPTSYMDNWKLEVAIKNWYKTVPLSVLSVELLPTYWRLAFVADFGTRNFNFKNKFDMENKTSTNHENGNDANRLLAVVLISLVWMAVLVVGVILAGIFNGEQFVIRCILIQPFSIGAVFASRSVWKHYR